MRSPDLLMVASGGRKDKKLKISEEGCEETEKGITKGCDVEPIGIEDIRNNPGKLDSMNVKELRTLAKSVGISTRGTKQDIISSLKRLSVEGKTTILKGTEMPSFVIGNDTFQKDAQNWSSEPIPHDQSAILDISENKQKRTRKRGIGVSITDGDDSRGKSQSCSQKLVSSKFQSCLKVPTPLSLAADTNEPWTWLAHKKPHKEWIPYNPRTMRPLPFDKDMNSVKLVSWNVNGLRALLKQESFYALQHEDFDVLCLQETKLQEKDVDAIKKTLIDGYDNSFWACSISKLGYSGTSIISRKKPISVNYGLGNMDYDTEGRIVTVEFDSFYLINGYVPNSGDGLRRLAYRVEQWDPALSNYMKELEKLKPVILTGDLNCAHEEIDIYDPVGNRRSAGFTNEERESFQKNFLSRGFIDTFRRQHPGVVAYTYWGYRHGGRKLNKGWRLDYFLASEIIADKVYDSYILPYVSGSDHCPIGLVLKI